MKTKLIYIPAGIFIIVVLTFFLYIRPYKLHSKVGTVLKGVEREFTIVSPTYHVDKIYKSMKGPESTHQFNLPDLEENDLIWITGFKAVMVGKDTKSPVSQEFMCHSNLDINMTKHRRIFKWKKNSGSPRLFTLSQGQYEIDFPDGYGIPLLAAEELKLFTQVLNLNDTEKSHDVRHKVTIK